MAASERSSRLPRLYYENLDLLTRLLQHFNSQIIQAEGLTR